MPPVYAPTIPVGTALYHLRKAHQMTQAELAERSGVGHKTIKCLERGHHQRPRRATLVGLARAFGMTLDQLKHDLGLAPFGSRRPEVTVSVQPGTPVTSPYGPRTDRLALMFLNLSPAQQDYLESVALALHSRRYQSDGRHSGTQDGSADRLAVQAKAAQV